MTIPTAILAGLTLVALGYAIADADEISEAYKLMNGCRYIGWPEGEILPSGMVYLSEDGPMWLCQGRMYK